MRIYCIKGCKLNSPLSVMELVSILLSVSVFCAALVLVLVLVLAFIFEFLLLCLFLSMKVCDRGWAGVARP